MGISQEILSNAALNLFGYLIAGALLTLLYSTFANRQGKRTGASSSSESTVSGETATTGSSSRRVEFVDLRAAGLTADGTAVSNRTAAQEQSRQRNRVEVMRLAREMLQSGTSRESVRNLLPISEGEMALLADKQRA